jgi:hypothetical protein
MGFYQGFSIYKPKLFITHLLRASAFGTGEEAAGFDASTAEEGISTSGFDAAAVASNLALFWSLGKA